MNSSLHLLRFSSLLLLSVCAYARGDDVKPVPVPPQMEDVKTPAPPPPLGEPLTEEPSTAQMDAALPPKSTVRTVGRGLLAGLDRTQVHFDQPGDGRIWAVGDAYKASFGIEGATYIPFLGSAAPQNFPVRFELRSVRAGSVEIELDAAAAPIQEGNRIVFDRGLVDEVYDLGPSSLEQSFVLDGPLAGELVIEIAVDTELARSADDLGLVLSSAIGSVRYGRAFAVDARAGRTEVSGAWAGEAIRIVVPAERVAATAWPLVVDPVINTFDVDDDGSWADSMPDVAYDASTQRWMAVYERVFSSTDHDVYFRIFETDGGGWSLGYIDMTTVYWANPKIANNNIADQFLCIAEAGSPTGGARTIRGRTRAALTSLGAQFTISGIDVGDKHDADVGGDPLMIAPTYYCVVYQRDVNANDGDIHIRLVKTDSTIFGTTIFLANTTAKDYMPSISKSDGAGPFSLQAWNIAWSRAVTTCNDDLWAAQIAWNGAIKTAPFAVSTDTVVSHGAASVSTSTSDSERNYLIACMRTTSCFGGSPKTFGFVCRGSTVVDSANLSTLSGAPGSEDNWYPSADCDGQLFVVADQETYLGSSDYDIYLSTYALVGNQITVAEGHKYIAVSTTIERTPEVACAASAGGPLRTTMAVWQDMTSDNVGDIEAGVYAASSFAQYCDPQVDGVVACPCGNAPTSANRGCNNSSNTGGAFMVGFGSGAVGDVILGAFAMPPSALCIFSQGDALIQNGVAFGDGIRCVGGQILRLATKTASAAGGANFPALGDPTIQQRAADLGAPIPAGAKRFYYTYYRDPAAYACSATFNTTNALQVHW